MYAFNALQKGNGIPKICLTKALARKKNLFKCKKKKKKAKEI